MLDRNSELLRLRCRQALLKDPNNPDAHHVLAMIALMEENYDEAASRLESAVVHRANFPEAHYNLADLRQRMDSPLPALHHYQLARWQDPERYGTYELYERAIACLQAALDDATSQETLPLPPTPPSDTGHFLSIVICSVDPRKQAFIQQHYAELLRDTPHEVILIPDARSLAEGYNRGIQRSRGDIVVFSHDDIEIVNSDFAARLCHRMDSCDVAGIAGTDRLDRPAWHAMGWPHVHGLCAFQDNSGAPMTVTVYDLPGGSRRPIQALDGLFLAVNRRVLDSLRFDEETFTGFHLYDLDFTYGAFLKGFCLDVCDDLGIVHASAGNYAGREWPLYAAAFRQKYAGRLAQPEVSQDELRWFKGVSVGDAAGLRRLLGLLHSTRCAAAD